MQIQKWDYAVLGMVKSYGLNYRINGEKQGQWKDQPMHVVFQQLGKVGFELVAYDGENYIFKRPSVAQVKANDQDDDAQAESDDE